MTNLNRDPSEGLNAAVAAEIRAERAARQVTIDELADRSSISKSTLLRLLNERRLIGMEALSDIARALGVSATVIVGRAERRLAVEQATGFDPSEWEFASQYEPGIEEDEAAL